MKVPPPTPRIDTEDALKAIARGETAAEYARNNGHSEGAVRRLLRRDGIDLRPKARKLNARETTLASLWRSILGRCTSTEHPLYERFGARGVKLCAEWRSLDAFLAWAKTSGYRPGACIDLRDRKRGYRPSNCVWASRSEVIRSGLRASPTATKLVTAFGESKSVHAWSKDPRCSVSGETLRTRLNEGLPPETAITKKPARPGGRRSASPMWNQVLQHYVVEGRSVVETAKLIGTDYHTVLRGLQKRGWFRPRPTPVDKLKHGKALQKSWQAMRERCTSKKHPDFHNIGARGIRVAEAWDSFGAFHAWALAAGYRPGLVLMRSSPDANYGPEACRWMTRKEQLRYRRPPKISHKPRWTIRAFGETKGPQAWTRDPRCTVSMAGLVDRLKRGMPPEEAITFPNPLEGGVAPGRDITAFGMTQTVAAWARDQRARVSVTTIGVRLRRGMSPEDAITRKPFKA
ncbi:MAG: hypothetical protein IPJ77_11170 [Planctomycetes bacterium]|nr:hypothetical protein [Planctomycetota bacterium]